MKGCPLPEQSALSSFNDRVINLLATGLIRGLKLLPYRARMNTASWVLRKILAPLVNYRRRARNNLAMIYPDMPEAERNRIADGAIDNAARTILENYSGDEFRRHISGSEISGPGLEAIKQAAADGRPVVVISGHFANYEAFRSIMLEHGVKIGGLYRPMRNPFFNKHYVETLTFSGEMFSQGSQSGQFFRFLKKGNVGILLVDVAVHQADLIPFLGREAATSTAAAEAVLRFDGLLVPFFPIRQDDRTTFKIEVDAPIAHSDPLTMTREVTQALEARIERHPDQWFWVHKRWK